MQVSAINAQNCGYYMTNSFSVNNSRAIDLIGDTSFNSLTPYSTKKSNINEKMPYVFDSINQWKNFCNQRVLGGKLNVIA